MRLRRKLARQRTIPVPCPPFPQADAAPDKRPVILVADDNADMRQYLVRLLGERYEIRAVRTESCFGLGAGAIAGSGLD